MESKFENKGNKNPKVVAPKSGDICKMYLNRGDLEDPDTFNMFVKAVENLVRKDPRYTNYIAELKKLGYTRDVFQAGIDSNRFPNTAVEMHHGPLFTLYDIVSIVTDHLLANDEKVCTFKVADIVLTEHELGRIQVVMGLTESNHQLAHASKLFIHMDQAIGDLVGFIKDFKKGFRKEHLYTMEEYFRMCKQYEATDNDYLLLRSAVEKIGKYMEKY